MLRRILSLLISPVFLISILLFGSISTDGAVQGWTPPAEEKLLSPESNGSNPLRIVIEPSQEIQQENDQIALDGMELSKSPDLGSDQVFPFVAGLDSY